MDTKSVQAIGMVARSKMEPGLRIGLVIDTLE